MTILAGTGPAVLTLMATPWDLICPTLIQASYSCMYIILTIHNFDCVNQSWYNHTMRYYAVIKNDNVELNLLTWKEAQNIWPKLNKELTKTECAEKFAKSII